MMKLSVSLKVSMFLVYSLNSSATYGGNCTSRYSSSFASSARTGPYIEAMVLVAYVACAAGSEVARIVRRARIRMTFIFTEYKFILPLIHIKEFPIG